MKYHELREMVNAEADSIAHSAAMNGRYDDGGAGWLRSTFRKYTLEVLTENDLRPSELENREIGSPNRFADIILKRGEPK